MDRTIVLFFLSLLVKHFQCVQIPMSSALLQTGYYGEEIVEGVDTIMKESEIFPDDHRFLARVAWIESNFGIKHGKGGIWRVSEVVFEKTKSPSFLASDLVQKVKSNFLINWTSTTYQDLEKPLYSGLAFKLILASIQATVPATISGQSEYWKLYYNSDNEKTAAEYRTGVQTLEKQATCLVKLNLVIVLDGSGSIGTIQYEQAKQFVGNFVSSSSMLPSKVGLIVYSDNAKVIFPLNNMLTAQDMKDRILSAAYPSQGTNTAAGIDAALLELKTSNLLGTTAPRIMLVLTDGRSNNILETAQSANNLRKEGMTAFAIGIGNAYQQELVTIAGNDANRVLSIPDYNSLLEFLFLMRSQTCSSPETPNYTEVIAEGVGLNEKRFYRYPLQPEGLTFNIQDMTGRTSSYYSYKYKKPSFALHDGIIDGKTYVPRQRKLEKRSALIDKMGNDDEYVYISVKGMETENNFTISASEGATLITTNSEQSLQENGNILFFLVINLLLLIL